MNSPRCTFHQIDLLVELYSDVIMYSLLAYLINLCYTINKVVSGLISQSHLAFQLSSRTITIVF